MRNIWIWPEICLQCRHEFARICRCRLGREQWTKRAYPVVVLPWGLPWFPGVVGNKALWP
jgi:hypothetical protein